MEEWLSAPGAYPEARRAIEALNPGAREELDRGLEPIELHAGDTLFDCGDPRDAAFLIVAGHIAVTGESPQGRMLGAGEGVGEIGLAARGPHTTTARALDEARVLRLARIAFEGLCEKYPEAMARLADFITPVAHETLLARVICDLLGERDTAALAALLAEMTTLELKRGDVLYRQGDDADHMYVVIYGRLRMVPENTGGVDAAFLCLEQFDPCRGDGAPPGAALAGRARQHGHPRRLFAHPGRRRSVGRRLCAQ